MNLIWAGDSSPHTSSRIFEQSKKEKQFSTSIMLLPWQGIPTEVYVISAISFVFHNIIFYYIAPVYLSFQQFAQKAEIQVAYEKAKLKKPAMTYEQYVKRESMNWNSLLTSSIHAIFAVFFSIICFAQAVNAGISLISFDFNYHSNLFIPDLSWSFGYFAYDMLCLLMHFPEDMNYIIHHICGLGFLPTIGYRSGMPAAIYYHFTEITTPFVNLRYFLSFLGYRHDKIYALNGIAMWLGFLICRMPLVVLMPWIMTKNWILDEKSLPAYLMIFYVLDQLAISYLNIKWFKVMTLGLLNVLKESSSSKKDEKKK